MGPGPASVGRLLPWDAPESAPLWTEAAPLPPDLVERLSSYGAAIVYSREPSLARRLAERIPRIECCDPLPPADFHGHASYWACAPVARLGGALRPSDPPPLQPPPRPNTALASLRTRLGAGFVALHPGSGGRRKNWPPQLFRQAGRALSAGRPWLASLGPAERDLAFAEAAGDGCTVASELSLPALAALLNDAGLYLGNDSGVTHLAAALGVPTLALFGPTDPATWAPVGPRARTLRSPSERMEDLDVDTVLRAAEEMRRAEPRLQV